MNIKNIKTLVLVLPWLFLGACMDKQTTKEQAKTEDLGGIEFRFDINDLAIDTRAIDSEYVCLEGDVIDSISREGGFFANFTIEQDGVMTTYEDYQLNYVQEDGGLLISDPLAIAFTKPGDNCLKVHQVAVYMINEDEEEIITYSSIGEDSPMAGVVDPEDITPIEICLNDDNLYEKTIVNLTVYCVKDLQPEMFGYLMWNVSFRHLYCLPFSVNICDQYTGRDAIGVGSMRIQTGSVTNNRFSKDNRINTKINFPSSATQLADLCFEDDLMRSNRDEWYRFILKIGSRTFIATLSVETLVDYINMEAWDDKRKYFHIWLCPGKDTFGFVETSGGSGNCKDTLEVIMPDDNKEVLPPNRNMNPTFLHWHEEYNKWMPGMHFTNEVTLESTFAVVPDSAIITTYQPYKFENSDSLLTYIKLVFTGEHQGKFIEIELINGRTRREEIEYKYTLGPIDAVQDTYKITFDQFVDTVDKECFWVSFEYQDEFNFREVHIKHDTLYTKIDPEEIPEEEWRTWTYHQFENEDGNGFTCFYEKEETGERVYVDCDDEEGPGGIF